MKQSLIKTTVTTDDGIFTCSHTEDWKPFDTSLGIYKTSKGIILWFMHEPAGTLLKYPCGTKRFIPEHTAPDLQAIAQMI